GAVVGQLVRVAERLAVPAGTEAAGDVLLLPGHRVVLGLQRGQQLGVTGLGGHVGGAGGQVDGADRVALDGGRLADRDPVGVVGHLPAAGDGGPAAGDDEVLGEGQVGAHAGRPV